MKIIIIGGVAGGATAAARIRRMNEQAEIILFERGSHISYAGCGLPYYIGGTIRERSQLLLQTPEGMARRYRTDVRILSEVIALNPVDKTVTVRHTVSGETYVESFDRLLLSTGAEPLLPSIGGTGSRPGIFTLRNVADADAMKAFLTQRQPKRAVVVGGGFIGLEMTENLHHAGLTEIHIVEAASQLAPVLDYSMAAIVCRHLKEKGVRVWTEEKVAGFASSATGAAAITVQLESGRQIETELLVLSMGIRPDTKLAVEAGLAIGPSGGIAVNEFMQTSHPDIYAAGDAAELLHPVITSGRMIPLAGPANKQARIAADNILEGNRHVYKGAAGTSVAKVFGLTVAASGVAAKTLKSRGAEYVSSHTHGLSHAGYYPEALPVSIKIIFDPNGGQLLGAQVVGCDGVDKRIELLSQIIRSKGTVHDLAEVEQAYAPPYSSAKDPVNVAGFVAENILAGKVKTVHWREIASLDARQDFLLDVRTESEHRAGCIEGSTLIPLDTLRDRLDRIPRNRRIIVYCAVGLRGYLAARILMQHGFHEVYNLSGGITTYDYATR
jgi:NADPH-dependent 2,4-dienoyl-CoA reductase/sulfur reductase-like enzyme/rhodanese-related sulfurtransferase